MVVTLLDDALVLAPKQDVDYRNLSGQPSPEDFFLLSRIRGQVTVAQVCAVSGWGREKTIDGLSRLLQFGLVEAISGPGASRFKEATAPKPPPAKPVAPPVVTTAPERPVATQAPIAPQTPQRAVAEPRRADPSFQPVIIEGNDDDLFEANSPAHLSRLRAHVNAPIAAAPVAAAPVAAAPVAAPPVVAIESDDADLFGGAIVDDEDDDDLFGGRADSDSDADLFGGASVPASQPVNAPSARPSVAGRPPAPDFGNVRFPVAWHDFEADPQMLSTGPELELTTKWEILYVHHNMEQMTYYDVLGAEPEDDARKFKKTYILLSKRFHPDLHFKKDGGEFLALSETIFKWVTKAFQTLSNPKKRQEYDESIRSSGDSMELGGGASQVTADDPIAKREMAFQILLRRGYALEEQGDFGLAVNEYRKALGLQRDDALLLRCATLLLHAGLRLDEAATYARAVLQQSPEHIDAWLLLGKVYERNNYLDGALEAYERAIQVAPHEPSLKVHAERIRTLLG